MNVLVAAELLKIRKRWMPYVLFLFSLLGAAVIIWLFGYVGYHEESEPAGRATSLRTFAFPWSLQGLLDNGQFWGTAFFVVILTASTVATEHSWGTVRQAVVRGQTRASYLAVKLAGLSIVCTAALLTVFAAGVAFSLLATSIDGRPLTLDVPDGPNVPEIALMILRAALGILPYGLLTFCLTVVGRSTALGLGGGIVYMFGEATLVAIFEQIGGFAEDARTLSIGHNVSSLIAANRFGGSDYGSLAARELPIPSELPDPWVATLILALYCAAFLAISFTVFQRRDIR